MKRAKIALTAIAMLAIVGGALALKANRGQGNFWYTTGVSQVCVKADAKITTDEGSSKILIYTTALCPLAAARNEFTTTTLAGN